MSIEAAFTSVPLLATERWRLRQMPATDVEALYSIEGDPEVTQHYGQEPHRSVEDTRA